MYFQDQEVRYVVVTAFDLVDLDRAMAVQHRRAAAGRDAHLDRVQRAAIRLLPTSKPGRARRSLVGRFV